MVALSSLVPPKLLEVGVVILWSSYEAPCPVLFFFGLLHPFLSLVSSDELLTNLHIHPHTTSNNNGHGFCT